MMQRFYMILVLIDGVEHNRECLQRPLSEGLTGGRSKYSNFSRRISPITRRVYGQLYLRTRDFTDESYFMSLLFQNAVVGTFPSDMLRNNVAAPDEDSAVRNHGYVSEMRGTKQWTHWESRLVSFVPMENNWEKKSPEVYDIRDGNRDNLLHVAVWVYAAMRSVDLSGVQSRGAFRKNAARGAAAVQLLYRWYVPKTWMGVAFRIITGFSITGGIWSTNSSLLEAMRNSKKNMVALRRLISEPNKYNVTPVMLAASMGIEVLKDLLDGMDTLPPGTLTRDRDTVYGMNAAEFALDQTTRVFLEKWDRVENGTHSIH